MPSSDLPMRLRAGAAILLQCPEHVRLNGNHVPMDANLYRRADEANEAAEEIKRLRLTDEERQAIERQADWLAMKSQQAGDIHSAGLRAQEAATLRGLLERMK